MEMVTIITMVTITDLVEDMEVIIEVTTIMIEVTARVTGTTTGMTEEEVIITKVTEIIIEMEVMEVTIIGGRVNFGWTEVTVRRRTDACTPTPADKCECANEKQFIFF